MSRIITIRSRCHTYPHEWRGECFRYTHNGEIKTLSWHEIKAIEKGLKSRQNDLLTTTEGRAWSLAKYYRNSQCLCYRSTHTQTYRKGGSWVPFRAGFGLAGSGHKHQGSAPFSIVP